MRELKGKNENKINEVAIKYGDDNAEVFENLAYGKATSESFTNVSEEERQHLEEEAKAYGIWAEEKFKAWKMKREVIKEVTKEVENLPIEKKAERYMKIDKLFNDGLISQLERNELMVQFSRMDLDIFGMLYG